MPANGGNVPEAKRPVQFTLRTLLLIVSLLAAALGAVRWLGAEVLPFILVAVGIWLTARTKARHLLVWLVPALWSMCAFGSWHHGGDEYGNFGWCILPGIWLALLPLNFGHRSQVYLLLIAAGALPMAVFGFLLDRLPVSRRLWGATFIVASVALFAWGVLLGLSTEKTIAESGWICWLSAYAFCAASLAVFGFLLDRLPVSRRLWGATFIVVSVALFASGLLSLASLEKAIGKDRFSLWRLWISAYAFCAANLAMYVSVLTCIGGGAIVWLWRRFRRRKEI